jgi:hypothetical protein
MQLTQRVTCSVGALVLALLWTTAVRAQQFSEWSAPVNLGSVVNSAMAEFHAFISKDGLSLYFASNRAGGFGAWDIYVSQRNTTDEPWGPPQNLGPTINTAFNESAPSLSIDGHRLYFDSDRPGGAGGRDLYVSRRHDKRDDFGWQPPENLGAGINTAANEANPCLFVDSGTDLATLYFDSDRRTGPLTGGNGQGTDIFASTLQPDRTFGPAWAVDELNTTAIDRAPAIRRDGLEIFLTSDREGGLGMLDLWSSTRATTADPWSPPVNLRVINGTRPDAGAAISFDGTILYFQSVRPGNLSPDAYDLWVTTRTKLTGPGPHEDW